MSRSSSSKMSMVAERINPSGTSGSSMKNLYSSTAPLPTCSNRLCDVMVIGTSLASIQLRVASGTVRLSNRF